MSSADSEQKKALQEKISNLSQQLEQARLAVRQWSDVSAELSRSAAAARAKNQGMGRGIGGALLGSKYRSAMRSAAASSNAAIAKEVAKKRAKIAKGKSEAQAVVQNLRVELANAKAQYKLLQAAEKSRRQKNLRQARSQAIL